MRAILFDFNGTLSELIQTLVIAGDAPLTNIVSVAKSVDDAEESSHGVVNLTSTDLELVRDDGTGAGDQVALRDRRQARLRPPDGRGHLPSRPLVRLPASPARSAPGSPRITSTGSTT